MIDFIVIGAQKSGTTSLHRYLSMHPQIYMPSSKELDFFSNASKAGLGASGYLALFDREELESAKAAGEASPQYMSNPDVPERIHRTLGAIKLIAVLRDPIDRSYSAHQMNVRRGRASGAFDQLVKSCDSTDLRSLAVIRDSEYGRILRDFLAYFPRSSMHVVSSDSLKKDPSKVLESMFEFLEVDTPDLSGWDFAHHHLSGTERVAGLHRAIRAVARRLRPHKDFIYRQIGRDRLHSWMYRLENEWNVKPEERQELKLEVRGLLETHFRDDVRLLSECVGKFEWSDRYAKH